MKNLFFYSGVLWIVSVFCFFSLAQENVLLDRLSSQLNYEQDFQNVDVQQLKDKFTLRVGFQQIGGFIVSANHIRRLFLNGVYQFKESWFFSLNQSIDHHAFINPKSDDRGIWLQDSVFSLHRDFTAFNNNLFSANLSASVPFSYDSSMEGSVTNITFNGEWKRDLMPLLNIRSGWLQKTLFFIQPAIRYYVSFYTTTPTENQSQGGRVLPEWLFGLRRVGMSFVFNDSLSLTGSFGRWIIFPLNTGYERDESNFYRDQKFQKHYYEFFLSGLWKINKQWSVSLSYQHNDRVDKKGRREIVLLDDRISTWSVFTSYLFSVY